MVDSALQYRCHYCKGRHYTWRGAYRCQDRYERNFDENEETLRAIEAETLVMREFVWALIFGEGEEVEEEWS